MSVGPTGMMGNFAGTPLSQAKGTDTEKTQQDTANQSRQVAGDQSAESAQGIGEAEQDEQTHERDADGRRLWEKPPKKGKHQQSGKDSPTSRDATGNRGNQLDLSG